MQVPGLRHAVGRVGEGDAGGGAAEPPQAELAREQVGADEAQRPGEKEQEVVADERRDGAGAEERRRAVAEQRVREGEAERVGVEGVGVEQVQRVVQHRVPHPRDLPGGAHRIAQVWGDAAAHVQDQRPAWSAAPAGCRPRPRTRSRANRAAATVPSGVAGSARARRRAVAQPREAPADAGARVRGSLGRAGEAGAHARRCSTPRGSAQHTGAACDTAAHRHVLLVTFGGCALRNTAQHASSRGGRGWRRGGVRGDRPAPSGLRATWCSPTSRSSARRQRLRALAEPDRFSAERVDASSRSDLVELIARVRADAVLNACDPRFNEPIFGACFEAKVTYLDMAMTLSHPHPQRPYELPGEMLGDHQLAQHEQWEQAGRARARGDRRRAGPVGRVRAPCRR